MRRKLARERAGPWTLTRIAHVALLALQVKGQREPALAFELSQRKGDD